MVSSRGGTERQSLNSRARQLGRERRGEPALAHPLELRAHLGLDLVEVARVDPLGLELRAEDDDRVPRPPLLELALGAIRAGIASRVADEAVRERLDEHRPVTRARMRDRVAGRLAHGPHAHAVDRLGGHAHDLGACPNLARGDRAERRVLAVAVVLADEHDGQAEDLREVETLEDVALVHRAVAEVRHCDAARRPLECQRRPGRGSDAPADDPERADQPIAGRVDVHRSRPAAVHSGFARPSISSSSACGSTPTASA